MKTKVIKQSDVTNNWYLIDAKGVRLGKLATNVSSLLLGKNKVNRASNLVSGDTVIIVNAEKIDVHKSKLTKKKYVTHSTYRGGYREKFLDEMLETKPERVLESAIYGMLPTNKLRNEYKKRLFIYTGSEHKHDAQKPIKYDIN